MLLESVSAPFQKAAATDATETSFTDKEATATEPTGNGVVSLIPTPTGSVQLAFSNTDSTAT